MLGRIETFLRIDSTMSAANIMRARAIYITSIVVFFTQLLNQISIYFMLERFDTSHIYSIIACIVVFGLGLALRWTKNFKLITCGFGVVLLLGVASAALPLEPLGMSDGINTSMLPILICGTLFSAMMYDWRAPLIFCIPAFAVIWGFYVLSMNYSRPDFVITNEVAIMHYLRAFQATLALTVSGIIASYFSYRMYSLFEELEANAEAARRAEGITSQYLADMSHEIRTPLNGIIGLSGYLANADISPKHKQYVDIIKESGDNLLEIINDVLDLSKLDAGKFTLDEDLFDLHRLCRSLTELHGTQSRAKGVAMQLLYDDDVPHHFIGDDGRIRQVLNNLLSNAVKFTQKGSVDLLIKGGAAQDGRYTLKIFVRDSGIGISDAQMPKLFERFEQLHHEKTGQKPHKTAVKGTGLGLSITKDLIEFMGGAMHVKSKPGKGTVFGIRLVLPLAQVEASGDMHSSAKVAPSPNKAA